MEMFEHVPVTGTTENKDNYKKIENFTNKCETFFELLNDMPNFLTPEYNSLKKRMDEFPKFKIKMNAIATIANALNTPKCKNAIDDGYRYYIEENNRRKNYQA